MTSKKTVRVPLTSDGVPIIAPVQESEKTRELPALASESQAEAEDLPPAQGAPRAVVDGEVTVPVQSSIESTLTFEVLRRQSTEEEDEDEKKP